MESKKYYSKLLVFGEYTVILGSQALAIPIQNFSGNLKIVKEVTDANIADFLLFVKNMCGINLKLPPDTRLENVVFESNIPIGYGVGSSGALCAAVYDNFSPSKKIDLKKLQSELASMEHFFHGTSSGIDPIVSYLNQPIISSAGGIEVCSLDSKGNSTINSFYLIDTGLSRQTGPLVKIFMEKRNDALFSKICERQLTLNNELAIDALLKNNRTNLEKAVGQISNIQFEYFKEMIPPNYLRMWEETLEYPEISLKLCGAGGGGFILAYCESEDYISDWSDKRKLATTKVLF